MFGFLAPQKWALHNPLKYWTLAGLSLRECQLIVASLTDAEVRLCWAHHDSWSDWKPLTHEDCKSLFEVPDKTYQLPPIPEIKNHEDHEITQVRTQGSSVEKPTQIHRKHTRYLANIGIEIIVGGHAFKTQTVDLSEGGFYLIDPVPDWVAGYFTVVLDVPGAKLEFTCSLVEDQKQEKFRIEIVPNTSEEVFNNYRDWLIQQRFPEAPMPVAG